jgi:hypothetical protein
MGKSTAAQKRLEAAARLLVVDENNDLVRQALIEMAKPDPSKKGRGWVKTNIKIGSDISRPPSSSSILKLSLR